MAGSVKRPLDASGRMNEHRDFLPVLARPGAKGIDPRALRRDGDLALLPRVRAGDATLPFAVLIKVGASTVEITS